MCDRSYNPDAKLWKMIEARRFCRDVYHINKDVFYADIHPHIKPYHRAYTVIEGAPKAELVPARVVRRVCEAWMRRGERGPVVDGPDYDRLQDD